MSAPATADAALLAAAVGAAATAYVPYSKFHVGAAVRAGGRVFTGCNIENASYGLTLCAERTAIFAAIAAGARRIDAVALACVDAGSAAEGGALMPCGACRQVMAEFAGGDLPVSIAGVGTVTLDTLLPNAFRLD